MTNRLTYQDWAATARAIKAAAKEREVAEGSDVNRSLRQAEFDRLLCRVFSEGEESDWLLKGGTGMLARVADARATRDMDLATSGGDLDKAQDALVELAQKDLGDHIEFELISVHDIVAAGNQPKVEGRRLRFSMIDATTGARISTVSVDMVIDQPPVGTVEVVEPAHRLKTARPIPSYPYRLYPLADQIADKVLATSALYGDSQPSSRVKDLVDLVIIANSQTVDRAELRTAIDTKRTRRGRQDHGIEGPKEFKAPEQWASQYEHLASRTPACQGNENFDQAQKLVAQLVDPALGDHHPDQNAAGQNATWHPGRGWSS